MTGDVAPKSTSACIWSLAVSDDSTVMSGDSAGLVQVWDGESGVLQQTLPQHHVGDVLALAVTSDGNAFFTAGVDGKVNCFRRSAATSPSETQIVSQPLTQQVWYFSQSHRLHSHDVFSLAICSKASASVKASSTSEAKRRRGDDQALSSGEDVLSEEEDDVEGQGSEGDVMSLLMSGGLDSKLCLYSARRFDSFKPFFLPLVRNRHDDHVIQMTSLTKSDVACVLKRHQSADVWHFHLLDKADEEEREDVSKRCELVLRLQQKKSEDDDVRDQHLTVALTSPSGRFFFMAGKGMVRLLAVTQTASQVIEEIALPALLTSPPRHVTAACFDEQEVDGVHLTLWDASQRHLLRLRIDPSSKAVEVVHDVALVLSGDEGLGVGRSPADRKLGKQVKRLHVSDNSKYVLVLTCADVIHIFQADK